MKYNFKKEHIQKLYDGGLISKKTAMAHGYADGGFVATAPPETAQPYQTPLADTVGSYAASAPAEPTINPESGLEVGKSVGPEWMGLKDDGQNRTLLSMARDKVRGLKDVLPALPPGVPKDILNDYGRPVMEEDVGSTGANMKAGMTEGSAGQLAGNGPRSSDANLNDIFNQSQQQSGVQQAYNQGAAQAAGQAGYSKTLAIETQKIQDDFQKSQDDANKLFEQAQSQAQAALAATPDPKQIREKFWDDKSTGQKVLAGIGLIMGAFSPDGVNKAVTLINNQIDQNIKAQELKQDQLGKMADRSQTLYSQLRQKGMDTFQARVAMKDLMLKDVQMQIQKQEANAKTTQAQAALQEAGGKVAKMMSDNQKSARENFAMRALQSEAKLSPKQEMQAVQMLPDEQQRKYIPGAHGFAKDPGDAAKIKENDAATLEATKLLTQLQGFGRSPMGSRTKANAEEVVGFLRSALRVPVLGPGTMQQQEYERLVKLIPDPSEILQANAQSRLSKIGEILKQKQQSIYEGYGVIPMGGQASLPQPGTRRR